VIHMAFPKYDYAQELATPTELGLGRGGGFDQIGNAIAGVNYYFDAVGFGDATGFARMWGNRQFREKQQPLGIQFFTRTGRTCPNGEPMYEYISTIPQGDIVGKRVKDEARKMGLPPLKGLGPGLLEDARDALNPAPFAKALNGEPIKCKKLRARVGDARGRLASQKDPSQVWITGDVQRDTQGFPTQEFWIQEGFGTQQPSEQLQQQSLWLAGILLGIVGIAILSHKSK
jgi:hypothetical protein